MESKSKKSCLENFPVFHRKGSIPNRIVVCCGFSGSGKSLLGPIVSTFKRMEIMRMSTLYERFCIYHYFNKITTDATINLLRNFSDRHHYEQWLSREVNLRPDDDSGLNNNPHATRTIKRLFRPDGDDALKELLASDRIQFLMMHHLSPVIHPVFWAWNDRVRIIKIDRHPLYLLETWFRFIDRNGQVRFGRDLREHTMACDIGGELIPWWAVEWSDKYISSCTMDKIIYGIEWLTKKSNEAFSELTKEEQRQILVIPFEKFVITPHVFLEKIENFIGTKRTPLTDEVLIKQKVPRSHVSAGYINTARYRYTIAPTENEEFNRRSDFVHKLATPKALTILQQLCHEYHQKHQLDSFPQFSCSNNG